MKMNYVQYKPDKKSESNERILDLSSMVANNIDDLNFLKPHCFQITISFLESHISI